jgi:hypothetical protein
LLDATHGDISPDDLIRFTFSSISLIKLYIDALPASFTMGKEDNEDSLLLLNFDSSSKLSTHLSQRVWQAKY